MNRFTAFMSDLRPLPKAIVITVLTLAFSHVALYDLTSVSFFSPMEKAADFRFSDFYTLVADRGAVAEYENNIVIVPVDSCDRRQMAETFTNIDFCAPAAVGLDIFFSPMPDGVEDPLAEALADCDNLIMPVMVSDNGSESRIAHLSHYDTVMVPSGGYAAINIQGAEDQHDIVREFRKDFETVDGPVKSMVAALVSIGRPDALAALISRSPATEEISYSSKEFEIVDPDEILDNRELIEGRIVLVGKLNDRGDKHITPIHNYTPGLIIHAYALSTIINGDYTRQLSEWESVLLGAILCFVVVWINLHLMKSVMGPLLVRSLQIGLLYLLVLTGTIAYIYWHIDFNFSYSMLTVSLGVAACEIYGAIFDQKGLIDYIFTIIYKQKSNRNEEKKNNTCGDRNTDNGGNDPTRYPAGKSENPQGER